MYFPFIILSDFAFLRALCGSVVDFKSTEQGEIAEISEDFMSQEARIPN